MLLTIFHSTKKQIYSAQHEQYFASNNNPSLL